jgi:LDH2 family malate/lactate/ureidoglycolate dehydrogenase
MFAFSELLDWAAAILVASGLSAKNAAIVAENLVAADAMGVQTHGLARLPIYSDRLVDGTIEASPQFQELSTGGFLTLDGDRGPGQLAVHEALGRACARLSAAACVPFLLVNTGHVGALGAALLPVIERGDIGFIAQSTRPVIAPDGARRAAIGNNPIAFAAPTSDGSGIVIDFAASVVAMGKVIRAAAEGQPLDPGQAIDANGDETRDPAKAIDGALRPAAGHKGLGLAIMVEMLAGVLGTALTGRPAETGPIGGGHLFGFVIRPGNIAANVDFRRSAQDWMSTFKQLAGDGGRIPGEMSLARLARGRAEGFAYPQSLLHDLFLLAERHQVTFPSEI